MVLAVARLSLVGWRRSAPIAVFSGLTSHFLTHGKNKANKNNALHVLSDIYFQNPV